MNLGGTTHKTHFLKKMEEIEAMNGGKIIKLARKAKAFTQTELANGSGWSLRTIQNWENGKTEPKESAVNDVLIYLQITRQEIEELSKYAA